MFSFLSKSKKSDQQASAISAPLVQEIDIPRKVSALLAHRNDLNSPALHINILDPQASASMSSSLQTTGIGKHLGLFALDDANDSNPYCYISTGIAAGMVMHFNHDNDLRIEFDSLNAFEAYLQQLRSRNQDLDSAELSVPAHPNQIALGAVLSELGLIRDDETVNAILCLYLPLLRGEHAQLLQLLSSHPDFFVREALAAAIGSAKLPESADVIRALVEDQVRQVRSAAIWAQLECSHGNLQTSPAK